MAAWLRSCKQHKYSWNLFPLHRDINWAPPLFSCWWPWASHCSPTTEPNIPENMWFSPLLPFPAFHLPDLPDTWLQSCYSMENSPTRQLGGLQQQGEQLTIECAKWFLITFYRRCSKCFCCLSWTTTCTSTNIYQYYHLIPLQLLLLLFYHYHFLKNEYNHYCCCCITTTTTTSIPIVFLLLLLHTTAAMATTGPEEWTAVPQMAT